MSAREFESTKAFVQFEVRAIEDRAASEEAGQYVGRDVDFVIVALPGSTDRWEGEALDWLSRKRQMNDRYYDLYQKSYDAWKSGQEAPKDGTSIRDWPNLTPAQRKLCESLRIFTVEDIAGLNSEGLQRLGMGAVALQEKARIWLKTVSDRGKLTEELASAKILIETLQADVKAKDGIINSLNRKIQELSADDAPVSKKETLKLAKAT